MVGQSEFVEQVVDSHIHATRPEALPPEAKSESVPTWSSCWGMLGAFVAAVSRRGCIRSTWLGARSGPNTARRVAIPGPNLNTPESGSRLQKHTRFLVVAYIHGPTPGLQPPTARILKVGSAIPQLRCQPMSMAASRRALPAVVRVGSMPSAATSRRQGLPMAVGKGTRRGIAHVGRRKVMLRRMMVSGSLAGAFTWDIAVAAARTSCPGTAAWRGRVTVQVKGGALTLDTALLLAEDALVTRVCVRVGAGRGRGVTRQAAARRR
jgi:hypothetical protein